MLISNSSMRGSLRVERLEFLRIPSHTKANRVAKLSEPCTQFIGNQIESDSSILTWLDEHTATILCHFFTKSKMASCHSIGAEADLGEYANTALEKLSSGRTDLG